MGVKGLYTWLSKLDNVVINKKLENIILILVDLNYIIYEIAEKQIYNSDEEIINAVINKIMEFFSYEAEIYVFALDGVPPMAKVRQQRERRFGIYLANENKLWDTLKISPGTEFMKNLSKKLKDELKKNNIIIHQLEEKFKIDLSSLKNKKSLAENSIKSLLINNEINTDLIDKIIIELGRKKEIFRKMKIHISDVDEEGEGEHKLLKYIFELERKKITLFFSNDMDTSLLTLPFPDPNIKVIGSIKKEGEIYDTTTIGKFISEYNLKEVLKKKYSIYNVMDFILLTFFCGNDFIPHLAEIKNIFMLDNLCNNYSKYINKYIDKYIVSDNGFISKRNLIKFLEIIIENISYYYSENNLPVTKQEIYGDENIDEVCLNWMEGINWTILYYNNNSEIKDKINIEWSYKYSFGPRIEDFLIYLKETEKKTWIENIIGRGKYLTKLQHLVIILPENGTYLLENNKNKTINNFPELYPTYIERKNEHFILPPIPVKKIRNFFK